MSVLKRLTVLQNEAAATPVPSRKYFHIGKPEEVGDVGECVAMLSWVDDNLSRYVVSDSPSSSWGRDDVWMTGLPNVTVANGDGVFLVSGHGRDRSEDRP